MGMQCIVSSLQLCVEHVCKPAHVECVCKHVLVCGGAVQGLTCVPGDMPCKGP